MFPCMMNSSDFPLQVVTSHRFLQLDLAGRQVMFFYRSLDGVSHGKEQREEGKQDLWQVTPFIHIEG